MRPQSSQFAEPLWTDPGNSNQENENNSGICVCELICTSNTHTHTHTHTHTQNADGDRNEWSNIFSKILASEKKATTTSTTYNKHPLSFLLPPSPRPLHGIRLSQFPFVRARRKMDSVEASCQAANTNSLLPLNFSARLVGQP